MWASEHYVPARKFEHGRKFLGYVRKGSRLEKELAGPTHRFETSPPLASLAPATGPVR